MREVERRRIPTPESRSIYAAFGKRLLDLLIAVPALIIAAPVIGLIALIVSTDGGPAIFGHLRVGRGGRRFRCLKIRSMVPDAEARLAHVLESDAAAAREWALGQKLENDPRITPIGNFLRKTSLDELPQLWNVIRGDMSLVGPRPVVPEELERYRDARDIYLSLRPGLTGPWQVGGRNKISYSDRVAMDAEYARTISMTKDLRIVALTAIKVLRPSGM